MTPIELIDELESLSHEDFVYVMEQLKEFAQTHRILIRSV